MCQERMFRVLTGFHIVGKFYRALQVIATRQVLISWISNSLLVCISKLTHYLVVGLGEKYHHS